MNKAMTSTGIYRHPNLVAHLTLDTVQEPEKADDQAKVLDSSGRTAGSADIYGRPKLIADQRFGACLHFNHIDQQSIQGATNLSTQPLEYLQMPLEGIDLSKGFSFSCWINIDSTKIEILDSGDFFLYLEYGKLKCGNPDTLEVEHQIKQGEWAQIGVSVQANGDTQLFINGLPIGEKKSTRTAGALADHKTWVIGKYTKDYLFKGKMAHIRFYNAALDQDEIHRQWALDESISKPLPFSQTAPVYFEFWDEQHQPVIYTQGGEISHKLSVALWNKDPSKRVLEFAKPKLSKATSAEELLQFYQDNHHFELRFPSGVLSNKSIEKWQVAFFGRALDEVAKFKESEKTSQPPPVDTKENWSAFHQHHPELNADSIYMLSPVDQTLAVSDESGEPIVMEVMLPHLTAQSGAYSVPVELRPGPLLSYHGESSSLGKRIRSLQIQTQKGHKVIPLHFGVVGSNTVINDGSETKLLLRLTNIDPVTTIKIKNSGNMQSQFILSCDLSKEGGHHEWALTDNAAKVTVEVSKPGIEQPDPQSDHWQSDPIHALSNGDKLEWTINGSRLEIDQLAPSESVYIKLAIKTKLRSGLSDVHLFYRHIEGYWDGSRACTIHKSPLLFYHVKNQLDRVGIGTNKPASSLSVTDGLTIGGKWAAQHQAPKDGLLVEGRVGFGTEKPDTRLHVHQGKLRVSELSESATIELKNTQHTNVLFTDGKTGHLNIRTDSMSHHVVLQSGSGNYGNVGINKSLPEATLHVKGALALEAIGSGKLWNLQLKWNGGLFFNAGSAKGGITRLMINEDSGNVGIGTITPTAKLSLAGGGIHLDPSFGNYSLRPTLTTGTTATPYEIRGSHSAYMDDGFLRLRAGGGTNTTSASYIDISGYSVKPDMAKNIVLGTSGKERMRIDSAGNIGIGTSPSKAKLEIKGVGSSQTLKSIYLVKNGNHFWSIGEGNSDARIPVQDYRAGHAYKLSIYASNDVAAKGFASHSDARIKTVEGRSNGATDLDILSRIEITDYLYKDVLSKGADLHKKVIAQQLESAYPQAVSKITNVVPDIYQKASVKEGWIALVTNLKVGERVSLIRDEGDDVYEVLEVRAGAFKVGLDTDAENLFVYGREVKDFGLVDYDAISMLNVSATQEMVRRIEMMNLEVTMLKKQVKELIDLLTRLSSVEDRLDRLELKE